MLNTFFGYSIFVLLDFSKLPTWVILLITNILGVLFNFFTTSKYVFNNKSLRKLPLFIFLYVFNYLISLKLLELLSNFTINRSIAMGILILPLSIATFFLQKKLIFYKN